MHLVRSFWRSTLGKKAVMAVTGIFLLLWTLGHVSGNLLAFRGPEAINAYAAWLRSTGVLLWAVRGALLVATALHVTAAIQLTRAARRARGQRYAVHALEAATPAARAMRWGGALLLVYVVYHLLHMTVGVVHPDFVPGDVHHNLVRGLSRPVVAAFYLAATVALGLHLAHGVWSAPRTLGLARPSAGPAKRRFALLLALLVTLGFAAVPLAVLAGLVR